MKKILITVGPIPARLDSVKFITNRFKGGLAVKTAEKLKELGNDVVIMAWRFSGIESKLPIILVDDVMDYVQKVMDFDADAYVLSAAVANLMPSEPYEGKFPSHLYEVGETFNVKFEIAPRVIDMIKKFKPKVSLVAYKLFDGSDDELISAGKKTLFESKANIVFANHPSWAKNKKIVLTQDGSCFEVSFDEHIELIHELVSSNFYKTKINSMLIAPRIEENDNFIFKNYPKHEADGRIYGTFAIKKDGGIITTTRGKQGGVESYAFVSFVDEINNLIVADKKATLNTPLLWSFMKNNGFNYVFHGHEVKGKVIVNNYVFPGSDKELVFSKTKVLSGEEIMLPKHGFIVGFNDFYEVVDYVSKMG